MKITKVFRKDLDAYRWKIDITVDGRRTRRADFITKQEAVDAIAALLTSSRAIRYGLSVPRPKITLEDLATKAEKDRVLKSRLQTLRVFKDFIELIGPKTELFNLTRADWKRYVDSLMDRSRKPTTINKYLSEISAVFASAPEIFPDLGEWRAPRVPWLRLSPGRDRLLSKDEIAKILAAFRSERQFGERMRSVSYRLEIHDLFRLMLLTGAREGELLNLKQSQVSWDWRTVRIESKKGGGSVRVVPLSDAALEILKARADCAPKFFKHITLDPLYTALRQAAKIAGVAYGDKIDNGWVLYDLRHVAATVMENAGVPYSAVSAILGHKRRDQTATYAHAQLDTLRKGIEILESWCREIDGFMGSGREFSMSPATSRKLAKG